MGEETRKCNCDWLNDRMIELIVEHNRIDCKLSEILEIKDASGEGGCQCVGCEAESRDSYISTASRASSC